MQAFLLENVANLTQMNGGRLLAHILEKLRGVGYQWYGIRVGR